MLSLNRFVASLTRFASSFNTRFKPTFTTWIIHLHRQGAEIEEPQNRGRSEDSPT
jgi:hypothetical protein